MALCLAARAAAYIVTGGTGGGLGGNGSGGGAGQGGAGPGDGGRSGIGCPFVISSEGETSLTSSVRNSQKNNRDSSLRSERPTY